MLYFFYFIIIFFLTPLLFLFFLWPQRKGVCALTWPHIHQPTSQWDPWLYRQTNGWNPQRCVNRTWARQAYRRKIPSCIRQHNRWCSSRAFSTIVFAFLFLTEWSDKEKIITCLRRSLAPDELIENIRLHLYTMYFICR